MQNTSYYHENHWWGLIKNEAQFIKMEFKWLTKNSCYILTSTQRTVWIFPWPPVPYQVPTFTCCTLAFVLPPAADWRLRSPGKNSVRDGPLRREIDFVSTNKGISFQCMVNQIISRNEGKIRLKSLTSNIKIRFPWQPVVPLNLRPVQ